MKGTPESVISVGYTIRYNIQAFCKVKKIKLQVPKLAQIQVGRTVKEPFRNDEISALKGIGRNRFKL